MQFLLLCMYPNFPFFSYMFIMLSTSCTLLNFISCSFPYIWFGIISFRWLKQSFGPSLFVFLLEYSGYGGLRP